MENKSEGYCIGELCNRQGCLGVISQREIDGGCSCHINPPCSFCTTAKEYCPECDWDAKEEQNKLEVFSLKRFNESGQAEYYKKQNEEFQKQRELFYGKYRGNIPIAEFDYRKESHTHFSMKVVGVHPKGFDLSTVMDKIRGTFGGRFTTRTETTFEYIAYTD